MVNVVSHEPARHRSEVRRKPIKPANFSHILTRQAPWSPAYFSCSVPGATCVVYYLEVAAQLFLAPLASIRGPACVGLRVRHIHFFYSLWIFAFPLSRQGSIARAAIPRQSVWSALVLVELRGRFSCVASVAVLHVVWVIVFPICQRPVGRCSSRSSRIVVLALPRRHVSVAVGSQRPLIKCVLSRM